MNIKQSLRKLRIYIGKLLFDKKTKNYQIAGQNYQKFLFLRQDGKIGDYIVSSFVFRELKKQNPNIRIDIVCTKKNDELFRQNQYIDNIYLIKKGSIIDSIKCGLNLRKNQYDVIIDPTAVIRNRHLLLLRLIQAKNYVGYQKQNYQIFNFNINNADLHFADIYKQSLAQLNFTDIDSTYDIPNSIQENQDIISFIKTHNLTHFIAVNFYGAGSKRSFNEQRIQQFLTFFAQQKEKNFVLLTFPAVTPKLKALTAQYSNIFIYENTNNIAHSIELIRYSDLLISPDTSTIHIAAGLNKPIIGFYSEDKENFTHWHPNSKNTTHILRYTKTVNEVTPEQIQLEWL